MRRSIALALSLSSVFGAAFSQTPTTPQKPPQEIAPEDIIRITTALIQTDVVVTDKNDQVIRDLKLDEFKVFENGKRQDVKVMEFVSPEAAPRLEGAVKIAGQAADSDVGRNLTAGELRRVFAFVVDDLTIPIQDVANVRKLLEDFVDNQMREGDLVAIIRVVGGSGLLQQFTSDKRILRRAISRINPQLSVFSAFNNFPKVEKINTDLLTAASGETEPAFPAEAISSSNSNIDSSNDGTIRGFRALATLQTAGEVTNSMRVLPGRKSLVLISGGLPLFESAQDQMTIGGVPVTVSETRTYLGSTTYLLNLLIDRASRAGVVINTLDIRGLTSNGGVAHFNDPGNEASSALFGGNNSGGRLGRVPNMGEFDNLSLDTMSGHMGLQALASSTGGVSVVNTNNFADALNRIVARSSYYLLAYTPTESFDAKFHKLEIKVTRPGAKVYAREGYLAKADPATTQTREDAIVRAAMSPLAKNEVEIAGRLQYKFLPDNRAQVDINLLINANNLEFKQTADGKYQSTFEVVGFLVNSVGRSQGGFGQTIHATLSPAEYKLASTGGISYTGHAELPPGTYQLRAVVREDGTGHLGSFSQYLEVPNLAKKHLTASSIFLYAVDPNPASKAPPDPLVALRQLPRKQDLRFAAIIYNPKVTDSAKTELRSQVFVSRNGKIVFQEAETPVTAAVKEGQVIKIGQLGLGRAQAGRYVLTLVITDPQADKQERTIVRSIDFTLVD